MNRIVCGRDAEVAAWVGARIPDVDGFGPHFAAIGVEDETGRPLAGVVYNNYSPLRGGGDVHLSMAADSPRWAQRGVIRALLHYPFQQLGCHRVTTVIAASNERAIRLNEGLGFKREGRVRQGMARGGDDAIVLGLLREDAARWLGE